MADKNADELRKLAKNGTAVQVQLDSKGGAKDSGELTRMLEAKNAVDKSIEPMLSSTIAFLSQHKQMYEAATGPTDITNPNGQRNPAFIEPDTRSHNHVKAPAPGIPEGVTGGHSTHPTTDGTHLNGHLPATRSAHQHGVKPPSGNIR